MPYTPTAEDIAKRESRKAEKAAKKAEQEANGGLPLQNPHAPRILKRQWVDVRSQSRAGKGHESGEKEESGRVTVATWNMLAQTLVRESLKIGEGNGIRHLEITSRSYHYCLFMYYLLFPINSNLTE